MEKYLRKILLLSMVILTLPIQAQHLKFMGIPLAGSIDHFSKRLAEKHIIPIPSENRTLKFGIRAFYGYFAERKSKIYVWYDRNKNVYSAKAFFYFSSEDYIDFIDADKASKNFAEGLLTMLKEKYPNFVESDQYEHNVIATLLIPQPEGEYYLGEISLWKQVFYAEDAYGINIQYTDYSSAHISKDKIKEDL